jgi:hypothetical protein
MIDMASVYAERFENNPDVLRAVLLTGRSPDPKLNAFTALRALQLQAEAERARQAQMAQQPTQAPSLVEQAITQPIPRVAQFAPPQGAPQAAPQSEGLAAMPAGEQNYAPGGIVSFAGGGVGEDEMPSIEAPSAGGGGSDEEGPADLPGLLTSLYEEYNRTGDPMLHRQAVQVQLALLRDFAKPRAAEEKLTPEQEAAETAKYVKARQAEAGESPFKSMRQEIAEARGERAKNLDRAQGVALLEAAREALRPGGTMRGLAGAAAAFGGSYGQALQADRAERRSLANMEMNIADAERKERMGLYGEARALRTAAAKEKRDADRFEQDRRANLVRLASNIERGLRPPTSAGKPPAKPKLPEITYENILADLLATEKPKEGESQDAFKARMAAQASREALGLARTSDIGPGKQQLGYAEVFRKIGEKADAAVTNFKKSLTDPNNKRWRELSKSNKPEDQAAAEKILTDIRNKTQEFYLNNPHLLEAPPTGAPRSGGARPAPAAGAAIPAPPADYVVDKPSR